ncbi:MAG: glycosyltransferase [Planctomycetaceae bacterium]
MSFLNSTLAIQSAAPSRPSVRQLGANVGAVRIDGKLLLRGNSRFPIQGVTYGPFAPDERGYAFPPVDRIRDDYRSMREAGVNAVRTYHVPPPWLIEAAEEFDVALFVDVAWSKHICFLDSEQAQAEARMAVRQAVEAGRRFHSVFAYSVGNEIPANIVRWHGARRVERFIAELTDVAKQADSEKLVTYANYPSTEFLDLSFLDFAVFNVYLHEREAFHRYLHRLQNLVGDKPLVLGELGMDSLREGEIAQADFLAGHLREAALMGLAGSFVFSWTDDWHTGGYQIEDWAFGLTTQDRSPKPAFHAVREVFESSTASLLPATPRVSVVVCSYNGAATLEQCLESLMRLNYLDYEVIVVDDGSTDHTPEILDRFPTVHAIRQPNRGLSAARNAGLQAATGSIVAYTDADCFVDRDWLVHLIYQLHKTGAAAVGGPNLTPDDGWLAACIAASPGQPTHVLENDQVAEHVPGCNMAFRREVLIAINGFQPQYVKAGDDVDICWRLQQAGYWITFAPGGFVWHHRRQTPRAYLRQQSDYGSAEALLRFQHPERFNQRGEGKWNGVMYGRSLGGLCLGRPMIYHGTFGAGLFQCVYQPRQAHWAMLPSTLEWHAAIALLCLVIPLWPFTGMIAGAMWLLSLLVAGLQSLQAKLAPPHDGLAARLLVMLLCYAQPLVRSWRRQQTRLFTRQRPVEDLPPADAQPTRPAIARREERRYWTEECLDRTQLLDHLISYFDEQRWSRTIDTGWQNWDLEFFCDPWCVVRIATAQEEHGGQKRLIRMRHQVYPSGTLLVLWAVGGLVMTEGSLLRTWSIVGVGAMILIGGAAIFWKGMSRAARAMAIVDSLAVSHGLISCGPAAALSPSCETTSSELPEGEECAAVL